MANGLVKPRGTNRSKVTARFVCADCGSAQPKWTGRCPDCGAWNTLTEETLRAGGYAGEAGRSEVTDLAAVPVDEELRTPTGLTEFDRVLGGGLVAGSVVLIGGDPGVGKSTLLLQALATLAPRLPALYVTGEESLRQVGLRAQRMGLATAPLRLLTETSVETILAACERERPRVLVIDSIQTLHCALIGSAPGSVAQVRESAAELVRFAKGSGTVLFLIGHVTKEGALAGPRVLEHMVDTVLYFEGDGGGPYRVLRAVKNRFGAANEIGVFGMTDRGLREVSNPSAIFLSRHEVATPGTAIAVTREGTRPMLVEVQALADPTHLPTPRRLTVGLDPNRLSLLLAVLARAGGITLYDHDVFVNVVGGLRLTETGVDLAVALAVLSSLRSRALPQGLAVFGEIGLAGEVRPVPGGAERLREAAKHGFTRAIVPRANVPKGGVEGLSVSAVTRLEEALAVAREG